MCTETNKRTVDYNNFKQFFKINEDLFEIEYLDKNANTYLTEQQIFWAVCVTLKQFHVGWNNYTTNIKIQYIIKACKEVGLHVCISEFMEQQKNIMNI